MPRGENILSEGSARRSNDACLPKRGNPWWGWKVVTRHLLGREQDRYAGGVVRSLKPQEGQAPLLGDKRRYRLTIAPTLLFVRMCPVFLRSA